MQLGLDERIDLRNRRQGELLIVTVRGVLTGTSMREARGYIRTCLAATDARAVVLDARSAISLLTEACWRTLAAGFKETMRCVPLALLVSPALHSTVRRMCQHAAEVDLLCVSFTDFVRAIGWASMRRQHWEAPPPHQVQSCPARQSGACSLWRSVRGCSPCAYLPD